MNRLPKFVK